MTKTKARAVARRARQYGYQQEGVTVAVFCPLCRERVENDTGIHGGTVTQRLDRAMLDHIESEHQ